MNKKEVVCTTCGARKKYVGFGGLIHDCKTCEGTGILYILEEKVEEKSEEKVKLDIVAVNTIQPTVEKIKRKMGRPKKVNL